MTYNREGRPTQHPIEPTPITSSPDSTRSTSTPAGVEACAHPGCVCGCTAGWQTIPNAITIVRTVASVALAMAGLAQGDQALLVIAYVVYIVGDVLDGLLARVLRQETRGGATFDIISDRVCAVPIFLGWVATEPGTALAVGIWLVGFAGVDLALSLGFRSWPLRGVGGFEFVDRALYRWNFTPVAKGLNSSVFIGLLVLLPTTIPAVIAAMFSLGIKSWSTVRLARLMEGAPGYACLTRDGEPRLAA